MLILFVLFYNFPWTVTKKIESFLSVRRLNVCKAKSFHCNDNEQEGLRNFFTQSIKIERKV